LLPDDSGEIAKRKNGSLQTGKRTVDGQIQALKASSPLWAVIRGSAALSHAEAGLAHAARHAVFRSKAQATYDNDTGTSI
jgi:hypothetical protein